MYVNNLFKVQLVITVVIVCDWK